MTDPYNGNGVAPEFDPLILNCFKREMGNIAWDVIRLKYDANPPINDKGELKYYIGGSLAVLALTCADRIQDLKFDKNGVKVDASEPKDIDSSANAAFKKFERKINDIDYIEVTSGPGVGFHPDYVEEKIPDIRNLSSVGPQLFSRSDPSDHELSNYRVSVISHRNSEIVISSPISITSFKLSQCIRKKAFIQKCQQNGKPEELINRQNEEYSKKIKDFLPLAEGVIKIYPNQVISEMKDILNEDGVLNFLMINEIKSELSAYPEVVTLLEELSKK